MGRRCIVFGPGEVKYLFWLIANTEKSGGLIKWRIQACKTWKLWQYRAHDPSVLLAPKDAEEQILGRQLPLSTMACCFGYLISVHTQLTYLQSPYIDGYAKVPSLPTPGVNSEMKTQVFKLVSGVVI